MDINIFKRNKCVFLRIGNKMKQKQNHIYQNNKTGRTWLGSFGLSLCLAGMLTIGSQSASLAQEFQGQEGANQFNNNQNQTPLSQQTVGGESEMMNIGELLGININTQGQAGGPAYLTLHDTVFSLIANNRKMRADLMSLHGSKLLIDRAEADYMPEVVVSCSITQNGVNPEESDTDNEIVGGEWNG